MQDRKCRKCLESVVLSFLSASKKPPLCNILIGIYISDVELHTYKLECQCRFLFFSFFFQGENLSVINLFDAKFSYFAYPPTRYHTVF